MEIWIIISLIWNKSDNGRNNGDMDTNDKDHIDSDNDENIIKIKIWKW